ncbi:MAG: hypothetical protein O6909_04160 [Alphaproteobacteria bacterium]|nr:hypothetical protein [Alphaproteobacteria bacterium]
MTWLAQRLLFAGMFGFSIGKLLVLAVILFVVLYGFKMIARASTAQRSTKDDTDSASRIDTVYDPETDSYVPKGTGNGADKK